MCIHTTGDGVHQLDVFQYTTQVSKLKNLSALAIDSKIISDWTVAFSEIRPAK